MADEYREPQVSGNYPNVKSPGLQTGEQDVLVVVTKAYDGHGNSLVRPDGETFDGFQGVTLYIELPDGTGGALHLSPIHGDPRKKGFTQVEDGISCRISALKGSPSLIKEGPCQCGGGYYHRIYLSDRLEQGEVVLVCDKWGCHRSRIIEESELLSWVDY